ncbi:MAG: molecular chaperone DnaJ [Desulfuromonas sp.]|uniref:J domain-containing protein n=1 Tax=Desulfuromonas sp. TaxID=892 RepID=UPI000CC91E86|nr:J domain-containing protein [Desulfuromonas sp.]PLX84956.1 MAG: molecular chaperone DnaJ [Desulfuromonas sp.]
MTFEVLQQALKTFGLSDRVSLRQIKTRHRELVKRFHPDGGDPDDPEQIRRINAAYQVLSEYCSGYKFSFSREEFFEQIPEERLREQFSSDPWGTR